MLRISVINKPPVLQPLIDFVRPQPDTRGAYSKAEYLLAPAVVQCSSMEYVGADTI